MGRRDSPSALRIRGYVCLPNEGLRCLTSLRLMRRSGAASCAERGMSASVRDRWRASAAPVKRRSAHRLTDQVHWTALRAKVQHTLCDIDALLPITMLPALAVEKVDASLEMYTEHNLQYLRHAAIDNVLSLCGLAVPVGLPARGSHRLDHLWQTLSARPGAAYWVCL
jgi:hypothetical protein